MRGIIEEIANRSDCEVKWRTVPPMPFGEWRPYLKFPHGLEPMPKRIVAAPDDIIAFRNLVSEVRLFKPTHVDNPKNGWHLMDTNSWLYDTVNSNLVGDVESGGDPYLERVFVLGFSEAFGLIAVDTHQERFGWIGHYWYEGDLSCGGFPAVAHSFTEWLERTLASGPYVRYWNRGDFRDLGPAIPNDPGYQPPNQHALA